MKKMIQKGALLTVVALLATACVDKGKEKTTDTTTTQENSQVVAKNDFEKFIELQQSFLIANASKVQELQKSADSAKTKEEKVKVLDLLIDLTKSNKDYFAQAKFDDKLIEDFKNITIQLHDLTLESFQLDRKVAGRGSDKLTAEDEKALNNIKEKFQELGAKAQPISKEIETKYADSIAKINAKIKEQQDANAATNPAAPVSPVSPVAPVAPATK